MIEIIVNLLKCSLRISSILFMFVILPSCAKQNKIRIYVNDVFSLVNSSEERNSYFIHFEIAYVNNSEDIILIRDNYDKKLNLDKGNSVLTNTFLCYNGDTLYGNRSEVGKLYPSLLLLNKEEIVISPNRKRQMRFTIPEKSVLNLYEAKYSQLFNDKKKFVEDIIDNCYIITEYQIGSTTYKEKIEGFGSYYRCLPIFEVDEYESDYED